MTTPDGERGSYSEEVEEIKLSEGEKAQLEAKNGLRQFDEMLRMVDQAIAAGGFTLRPSDLLRLHRIAVESIRRDAGSFRLGPSQIRGREHIPPDAKEVPVLVEEMCEYVNGNQDKKAVHLSAYVLWRLNWIHPFGDGNGRTSRATSYFVLCAHLGQRLPGPKTIPERIASYKSPYYFALEEADEKWKQGEIDVDALEHVLSDHLAGQLREVFESAGGRSRDTGGGEASAPGEEPTT